MTFYPQPDDHSPEARAARIENCTAAIARDEALLKALASAERDGKPAVWARTSIMQNEDLRADYAAFRGQVAERLRSNRAYLLTLPR